MPKYIGRIEQIEALNAAIRQEIIDVVHALGPCTARQIAEALGQSLDGIYYHLKILLDVGLIVYRDRDEGEGRIDRLFETFSPKNRLHIRYRPGRRGNAPAVAQVAKGMCKSALKEFEAGLRRDDVVCEGDAREIWAARAKGWLSKDNLKEANALLARLHELFSQAPEKDAPHFLSLTFITAPCEAKPLYR